MSPSRAKRRKRGRKRDAGVCTEESGREEERVVEPGEDCFQEEGPAAAPTAAQGRKEGKGGDFGEVRL